MVDVIKARVCSSCGKTSEKWGTKELCYSCYNKKWQQENRKRISENQRKRRESDSGKTKLYDKRYYVKNKNRLLQYQKKWVSENKEWVALYRKDYRLKRREAGLE